MYKIGTRIKKVRGRLNVGVTGIVVGGYIHPVNVEDGCDIVVKPDTVSADYWTGKKDASPGATKSCNWEPIIPEGSNVPSEASIHELLDSKFYEKENCNV